MEKSICTEYRRERTAHGHPFDEIKSAIQKSVRRSMVDDAVWFYLEAETFGEKQLGSSESFRGEPLRTNLLHRLMVIYLEDIGPANPALWSVIDESLFKLFELREQRGNDETIFHRCRLEEISLGVRIVQLMASSPHSRQLSHLHCSIDKFDYHRLPDPDTEREINRARSSGDLFVSLEKAIIDKSVAAFYYSNQILNGPLIKRRKPMVPLLEFLGRWSNRTIMAIRWAKELTVTEQFLIPMLVISEIIGMVNLEEIPMQNDPIEANMTSHLEGPDRAIPSYAVDMHTKAGRKLGKNKADFGKSGMVVTNEWSGTIDKYKQFYYDSKIDLTLLMDLPREVPMHIQEKSPEYESQRITFGVRAQLNTMNNRPDTYLGLIQGKRVFVKGPYLATPEMPLKVARIKKLIGLPYLEYSIEWLIPDYFPKLPLGVRNKVDRKEAYPFLLAEDLTTEAPIPTIQKSSKRWPETEVVDWKRVNSVGEPEFGLEYLKAVIFRWLFGIPDLAMRNFIQVREGVRKGELISVDEEELNKAVHLYTSLKKNLANRCRGAVDQEVVGVIKRWAEIIESQEMKTILANEWSEIRERAKKVDSVEDVKKLFENL